MKKQAKVTSKGQITIRGKCGAGSVRAGDRLQFEEDGEGMRVTAVRKRVLREVRGNRPIQESEKAGRRY